MSRLDWAKAGGLLPAIVQDAATGRVLMLGTMSPESLRQTRACGRVTFFSRSRKKIWRKGETSGNFLKVRSIRADCDSDALLILAEPAGPTCHRGTQSCFEGDAGGWETLAFLEQLERVVDERFRKRPPSSYVSSLIRGGIERMAQKVGEEAVETALAAKGSRGHLESEAADLLFHLLVLLRARGSSLAGTVRVLQTRHAALNGPRASRCRTQPASRPPGPPRRKRRGARLG